MSFINKRWRQGVLLTWDDHQTSFGQSDKKFEFQRSLPFALESGVEFEMNGEL